MAVRRSSAISAEPGEPGQRIYFVSLGCPKNQVDTELMLGQVQAAGHALVDAPDDADVIVVNTCAFIDAAKEERDRKSTRLNSSHSSISYAVFCLKKKKTHKN